MTNDEMWDALLEQGVTEQTLQIVTSGWGYNTETLETVLYAHTGYRSFGQLAGAGEDDDGDEAASTFTFNVSVYKVSADEQGGARWRVFSATRGRTTVGYDFGAPDPVEAAVREAGYAERIASIDRESGRNPYAIVTLYASE